MPFYVGPMSCTFVWFCILEYKVVGNGEPSMNVLQKTKHTHVHRFTDPKSPFKSFFELKPRPITMLALRLYAYTLITATPLHSTHCGVGDTRTSNDFLDGHRCERKGGLVVWNCIDGIRGKYGSF
jgi:hypothetical protein